VIKNLSERMVELNRKHMRQRRATIAKNKDFVLQLQSLLNEKKQEKAQEKVSSASRSVSPLKKTPWRCGSVQRKRNTVLIKT
jgi:hypothetical protein